MRLVPVLILALVLVTPLAAQQKSEAEVKRLLAAHEHDFDYLLGDWEFTTVSKEWGNGHGVWSAMRLESGAVFDEYRILGDTGQTWYVTHTLRSYNAVTDRWDLVGTDHGTGLASVGHGTRKGNEVHLEQNFTNPSGPTSITRIRYHDITPDSFNWESTVSKDGGKTWIPKHLVIKARRLGPPRTALRLTPK